MKFYEFEADFDYYALIGAENQEKAIEVYNEFINESDDWQKPREITIEVAKEKLMSTCNNNRQKRESLIFWEMNIESSEPFLILIDSGLL